MVSERLVVDLIAFEIVIMTQAQIYFFDIFQRKTFNLIYSRNLSETPIKTLCVSLIGATLTRVGTIVNYI